MSTGTRRSDAAFEPSWRRGGWRLDWRRRVAAACMLSYAAALLLPGTAPARLLAGLVVVDVGVMLLPWRVPRAGRSLPSLWLETLAYLVAPVGAVLVAATHVPAWLALPSSAWWYPAGILLGAGLVLLSGIRIRLLVGGELAFLAGPERPGHAWALASSAVVAAAGEEALFRGTALAGPDAVSWSLAAVAVLAFVARHHLPPGASPDKRATLTQCAAAAGLLALTVASGSLLPAMLAHLLNNAPHAVLALQRGRLGGRP